MIKYIQNDLKLPKIAKAIGAEILFDNNTYDLLVDSQRNSDSVYCLKELVDSNVTKIKVDVVSFSKECVVVTRYIEASIEDLKDNNFEELDKLLSL